MRRLSRRSTAAIGIDIGGTEFKAVLGTPDGAIGEPLRRRSSGVQDANRTITEITDLVGVLTDMAAEAEVSIHRVGLAVPGRVDPATGRSNYSANLGWADVPIGATLEAALGLPVHVEHDVYAGALAEFTIGAGKGVTSGAFVPVGTGIAAALFMDGRFWRGASGFVGEIGHIRCRSDDTPCSCGRNGCVELFASARGLVQIYARLTDLDATGQDSANPEDPSQENEIGAKEIATRAANGEPTAAQAWDTCVGCLARALAALTLTTDINTIVIGGGLSESGAQLLKPLVASLSKELAPLRVAPELRRAALGQLAGAHGAALHALIAGLPTVRETRAASISATPTSSSTSSPTSAPTLSPAMFMLAFDHRASTARELFGQETVSPKQWEILAEAKTVIAEAVTLSQANFAHLGEVSVLVDPECGSAAAHVACEASVPVALALEVSGQRQLELLDETLLRTTINTIGSPRWGKVLLRWNPGDSTELKDANLTALNKARRFCDDIGIELLLELIVAPTSSDLETVAGDKVRFRNEVLPLLLPAAVGELTLRFGTPDLWKLQGVASTATAALVSEAACVDGVVPPIVILGAGADSSEITRWFAAAAGVRGYSGFAIGRSIWKAPIASYLDGQAGREETQQAILSQFVEFIDNYVVATQIAPVVGT